MSAWPRIPQPIRVARDKQNSGGPYICSSDPGGVVGCCGRCNVDLLKMIQLGLTFSDGQGNYPPECATWQFNFKISLT